MLTFCTPSLLPTLPPLWAMALLVVWRLKFWYAAPFSNPFSPTLIPSFQGPLIEIRGLQLSHSLRIARPELPWVSSSYCCFCLVRGHQGTFVFTAIYPLGRAIRQIAVIALWWDFGICELSWAHPQLSVDRPVWSIPLHLTCKSTTPPMLSQRLLPTHLRAEVNWPSVPLLVVSLYIGVSLRCVALLGT